MVSALLHLSQPQPMCSVGIDSSPCASKIAGVKNSGATSPFPLRSGFLSFLQRAFLSLLSDKPSYASSRTICRILKICAARLCCLYELASLKNQRSLFPQGGKVKVSFSHFMHNTSARVYSLSSRKKIDNLRH